MLEMIKIEAKSKENALEKALEELNVQEKEVYYYFEETEGGLFKGKKYTAVVTTKYAYKEKIKQFLNDLATKLQTKFNLEIKENEHGFSVLIVAEDSGALIGRDGKTLNSIQTILRQSLRKYGKFDVRVYIDISNYKARKEKNITYEVKQMCKEILKTKISAKLDSMNSYERRVVHNIVGEFKELESCSEGEQPNRYVVIRYKE